MKNLKHWSNNFAGAFAVSVIFFVITLAANRANPATASTAIVWFFVALGLVSLIGWTWCAFKNAEGTATKILFERR